MTRMRYMMPARSQGKLHAQRTMASLAEKDVHRWVFAHSLAPEAESAVRSTSLARTHIVLNNTPPLSSVARGDEAVEVNVHTCPCAGGRSAWTTWMARHDARGFFRHRPPGDTAGAHDRTRRDGQPWGCALRGHSLHARAAYAIDERSGK